MEGSGAGSMSPARVKEEPPEAVTDLVVKEEVESVDEEEWVKTEPSGSDSADSCGVSEAAALAGLYTDHIVKDELVLGPERPHRPDVGLLVIDWALGDADGRPLSECAVSNDEGRQPAPRDTNTPAHITRPSFSGNALALVSSEQSAAFLSETLQRTDPAKAGTGSPDDKLQRTLPAGPSSTPTSERKRKRHRAGRKRNGGQKIGSFRLPHTKQKPKPKIVLD